MTCAKLCSAGTSPSLFLSLSLSLSPCPHVCLQSLLAIAWCAFSASKMFSVGLMMYGNFDVIFGHCSRIFKKLSPPHTRRVMYPASCPCVLGADWCLQSDVMPDSPLQAQPAGPDSIPLHAALRRLCHARGLLTLPPPGKHSLASTHYIPPN